ncbi:MAG: type II toxin-antitoxin system VapC family toxin [Candidatus Tectomicrobia bacterium]|nr:type II toxin-antitoxin system VapC family toxin [Candidatus Tectomicrobia bacterium]
MARFLLDTSLLLGFIRQTPWALWTREEFKLGAEEVIAFTSVICRGEILALAEKNGWGSERRTRLERVLNEVPTLEISGRTVLDAYARIDAWTHGRSVKSPHNAPPPKPAVSMKQNDIWIAATAHASEATLLSTDKDFQHLNGVWIEFFHIDQAHRPLQ